MKPKDVFKAEAKLNELADNYDKIPFWADDFYGLLFRFLAHLLVVFIIIRLIYYPTSKRKDFLLRGILLIV